MSSLLAFTLVGIVTGAGYAIAASGLVVTYTTSRVFNVGHGAVGMFMAFLFWELSVNQGLPSWLALLLVVGLIAPLTGIVLERTIMRVLTDAPVSVTLVVTVGLMVGLIGAAQSIWPPTGRPVQPFFGDHGVHLGEVFLSAHDLLTIVIAVGVAVGLYFLLNRTRMGIAMRAAVDNRTSLALYGGRPHRVSAVAWAVGCSLSALGGILLTPYVQLDYFELTLLVISAFAAAMLGRLTSLPLTFVGSLVLGLLQSYAVGYLPTSDALTGFRAAIPTLFLFAVVLLMPQTRLRVGQIKGIAAVPVPSASRIAIIGSGFVVVMSGLSLLLPTVHVSRLALALAFALIMLSLMLLTGYGGYVSLAQFTFVGIGALTVAKLETSSPLALVAAALVSAAVGALVAVPTLRLTGLYLALSTLAFGQLFDKLVFQSSFGFGFNSNLSVPRLEIFGLRIGTERGYAIVLTLFFVVVAAGLLTLRRGRIGRQLIAMRDSPAACGTLGLNQRFARVALFAASAGLAGLAGGLFAGLRQTIGAADFTLLNSLSLLLLAVVGGVTSASGAFLGGWMFVIGPILTSAFPSMGGLFSLGIGLAAISLGRDPNGQISQLFDTGRKLRRAVDRRRPQPTTTRALSTEEVPSAGTA